MHKAALFLLLSVWASLGHSEVQIVSVTAYGEGVNQAEAVKAAQIQAVGQVSGELLAAYTAVDKKSYEVKGVGAVRNRAISTSTESLVKGVIKSTTLVKVIINPKTGLYEAEIQAEVAKVGQSEQLKRRRIAIVPATSSSMGGNILEVVRESVEAGLVASRKMAVLDRKESSSIESEVQLMLSDRVPVEERLKAMNLPTADLMGLVSIEGIREVRDPLNQTFTELSSKITIVDVASRQVKFRKTVKTLYPGGVQSAIGSVGKVVGDRIAKEVLDFAYPMMIISENEGVAVVSGGSTQLRVAQAVKFYKLGRVLTDPYTGERVGQDETDVGSGEVISVERAIAHVKTADFIWRPGTEYVVKVAEQNRREVSKTISESDW